MESFFEKVIKHRKKIIGIVLIACCICFVAKSFISVNYDMNDYLPEDASSTVALDVMEAEFDGGIPNARVMLNDVSITEALEYKEKIEAVEGVSEVTWIDDAVDMTEPVEIQDKDTVETYYKDNAAIFSVTILEENILSAVAEIREIIGDENCMSGAAVSTAVATNSTISEIQKMTVLAVLIILLVLFLTTSSWIEPVVVMIGLGVAIVINMGTNLIFGEISFVTNAAGTILQMAVSLDYSVFLIHRFEECRESEASPSKAMNMALCKSVGSIASSGLTTVIGFLALCFMRFGIGPDLGMALAKGVAISLMVVFVFMPGLILLFYPWMDKTRHRPLVPSCKKFGAFVSKITIPFTICFVLMIVPSYLASTSNNYYFGSSHIFSKGTQLGDDTAKIKNIFGKNDTYVLLVPKGDTSKEAEMLEEIKELSRVRSVIAFVEQAGPQVPYEYLDEETLSKLESEHYSRMVLSVKADYEGQNTTVLIQKIKKIAENYYPGEYHLAGEGVSTYDLMETVMADMIKVNLVSIGAVFLVLVLTLKSLVLPFVLVMTIETAIWINLSIPYYGDFTIFYIAYLIISSVQLGATVDYAILLTDRYRENRENTGKKECVKKTVSDVTVSIMTSGIVLTSAGFLLGEISSHGVLKQLGMLLGRGTICSMIAVLFVLPGLLYVFDKVCVKKEEHKMKSKKKKVISAILTVSICLSQLLGESGVSAAQSNTPKEEVVYATMDESGKVTGVYVVNVFSGKGEIVDYGEYTDVRNMTTTDEISINDDCISVKTDADKLYYQGNLKTTHIPWDISIKYYLDDKEYTGREIAGKSGKLKIVIKIRKNDACDESFFEGYALQASLTLDSKKAKNIVADDATIANVGADKQLSYIILPGKEKDLEITADVTDFEMDEISINGVKLNLNIDYDTDKINKKVSKVQDAAVELNDGAEEINDGTKSLYDGTVELSDGASDLQDGVDELKDGIRSVEKALTKLDGESDSLITGSADVTDALATIQTSLGDVAMDSESIGQLAEASTEIKNGIDALVTGLYAVDGNIDAYEKGLADSGLTDINTFASKNLNAAKVLGQYNMNGQFDEVIALLTADASYINGSNALIKGISDTLDNETGELMKGAVALQTNYAEFDTSIQELTTSLGTLSQNMAKLKSGIDKLVKNYNKLDSGINEYTDAVAKILNGYKKIYKGSVSVAKGTSSLYDGTVELVDGSLELNDGTKDMYKGTKKFYNRTKDMDAEIEDTIDETIEDLTGTQVETVSFVSEKNKDIKSVQFVLKTPVIEIQEEPKAEAAPEKKTTILQKFLHLFGF